MIEIANSDKVATYMHQTGIGLEALIEGKWYRVRGKMESEANVYFGRKSLITEVYWFPGSPVPNPSANRVSQVGYSHTI